MNKLLKLISVNLMALINYNGVMKEIEAGIKGKNETRLILVALVSLIYGYFVYVLFNLIGGYLTNKYLIFLLGFVIATVMCFVISSIQVGPVIFKNEDTEYLLSLPLTKHQIIISKLFNVYIRNLLFVIIVMAACLIAYNNYGKVNEVLGLVYFINGLLIPVIPIVITVLVYYFNYNMKFTWKKVVSFLTKSAVIVSILLIVLLLIRNISFNDVNSFVEVVFNRIKYIYPTSILFVKSLETIDILSFVVYLLLNIIAVYIFMLFILKNYNKICTLIKGVKSNRKFVYGKQKALGHRLGSIRKEILFVIKNKMYCKNSYSILVLVTLLIIIGAFIVPIKKLVSINNFYGYYNMMCPFILAGIISLGNSTISSISLEKNNREMLCTLPIKLSSVLYYKWLANVLVSGLFLLLNGTILNILFKPNTLVIVMTYVLPLLSLMVVSLISLLMDYKYVVKKENDDGIIIKQRFISLVPPVLSLLIMFVPIFIKTYQLYKNILLSFSLACIIGLIICGLYLLINWKKLRKNLIY